MVRSESKRSPQTIKGLSLALQMLIICKCKPLSLGLATKLADDNFPEILALPLP